MSVLLSAGFQFTAESNDDALRDRLKTFYDCYLTGHFRQADELVAPESKDAFFDAAKERFRSYAISRIDFKENGNVAEVILVVDTQFQFGGRSAPVRMPLLAHWKKITDEWYWCAPSSEVPPLPFGVAETSPPKPDTGNIVGSAALPRRAGPRQPLSMTAMIDKPVLTLSSGRQERDTTHLRNTSKQTIQFHIEFEPVSGVDLTPLEGSVNPGESISIQASLPGTRSGRSRPANLRQPAYIVVRSGIRIQFYVAVES